MASFNNEPFDPKISETFTAPTNIAVIKYWGKNDVKLNTPMNSSASLTLDQSDLHTITTIAASKDYTKDRFWLNGTEIEINSRGLTCLKEIRKIAQDRIDPSTGDIIVKKEDWNQYHVHISSVNTFPTGAGLASSAAGLACFVATLAKLYNAKEEYPGQFTAIARQGSGSASRSMFGGFVRWEKGIKADATDSIAVQIADENYWPEIRAIILVVSDKEKDTSSTSGMETSRLTSLLLGYRASEVVQKRLDEIEKAYLAKDFETFGRITMQDSNQFHAVCLDTYPPIFYMNDTSKIIIRLVHVLNSLLGSVKAAYTFDAGPNAVIYTTDEYSDLVLAVMAYYFPAPRNDATTYCNKPEVFNKVVNEIDKYITNEMFKELNATGRIPKAGDVKYVFVTKSGPGPISQDSSESLLDSSTGLPIEPGPKHKRMEDLNFRRNVDPELRRKTNKSLLELKELQQEYTKCKKNVDQYDNKVNQENEKLINLTLDLEAYQNKLSNVQEEIDCDYLPEGAQPRERIQRRDTLNLQVQELEASLEAQRQHTQLVSNQYLDAEKQLFTANKNLAKFAETLEDVVLAKETIAELDREKLRRVAEIEHKSAIRKEKTLKAEKEAKEAQIKEMEAIEKEKEAVVKKLNTTAKQKLHKNMNKQKEIQEKKEALQEEQLQERMKVVYALKQSQASVNSELAGIAAKHRAKVADAAKRLEDDKEALLSKGLNPYIEFRKKELANEARHRESKLKEAVEKNKLELASRMIKEEKFIEKQDKIERKAHEYERVHRASQGRHVVENKNNAYILEQTKGKMEVLDPLGKAIRIYPSQIVEKYDKDKVKQTKNSSSVMPTMKPGDNIKDFTKQIRQSLNNTTINELEGTEFDSGNVVTDQNLVRTQSAPNGDKPSISTLTTIQPTKLSSHEVNQFELLATQPGAMPGSDKTAIQLNLNGNITDQKEMIKLAIEEEGQLGASNQLFNLTSPKYKLKQLSKFERDALDRAKERHTELIEDGMEQIAGGKTFHGKSFVSTPAELIFYDFEVGKKYKKRFTLTNVSYTFNSFKYIDLDESVRDFFIVTFEKPGRMSAGMACYLDIEFIPRINQDVFTELKFFTQTGPVEIPLHCLIKRCAPRITTTAIDFGTIVMGQKLTISFKMINSQAISTKFAIYSHDDDNSKNNKRKLSYSSEHQDGNDGTEQMIENEETLPIDNDLTYQLPDSDHIGNEPALNQAELSARVNRVITEVIRNKKREHPNPLSCKLLEGSIDGYGNASVEILCAPLTLGEIIQKFVVVFESVDEIQGTKDDTNALVKKEQFVTAKVYVDEVPIYVAEDIMDFNCTLYQRIYRKKITLKNRGKSAYRIIVKISPRFSDYVEVNPDMFFVQSKSSQSMNIKFTPTVEMLQKVAHFILPYEEFIDSAYISLPIEIQVVNQEIPAYFTLVSSVTYSTIELSTKVLDFGKVYVGQKSTRNIKLHNISMLPQKIGFVKLRKEFIVQPNDGFTVLLPNESMEFEVSFGPQSSINYELNVVLLTSFNDTYNIKVLAEGVDPPISLSSSVIHMRTTYPGERVLESTLVRNTTKHTQCFQVMMPHKLYSWLTVSPAVLELQPGQAGRLEIEFCPPANAKELDPTQWHSETIQKTAPEPSPFETITPDSGWIFAKGIYGNIQWVKAGAQAAEVEDISTTGEEKDLSSSLFQDKSASTTSINGGTETELSKDLPDEEWGIFGQWNLPLLLKPRKKSQAIESNPLTSSTEKLNNTVGFSSPLKSMTLSSPTKTKSTVSISPLFLTIETSVTLPQLESDMKVIDFGQVSIGTRIIKSLKILNRSSVDVKLRTIGFNAVGPFTLLKPIKKIGPNEAMPILVECLPARSGLNVEVLEISSEDPSIGGHRITLTFKVQGLQPSMGLLGLQPPPKNWDPKCGILDFGHVLTQDYVTKKFTIQNKSTFAINIVILRVPSVKLPSNQQSEMIERTFSGLPIFSICPMNVVIEEGQSQDIEITFCSDRGRFQPFREDIDVTIADTEEVIRVGLFGRSWDRQLILVPQDPLDEPLLSNQYEGTSAVEDVLSVHPHNSVRTAALAAKENLKLSFPDNPKLSLIFPDPFNKDALPTSFTEIAEITDPKAKGGGGSKVGAAVISASPGARSQIKRIVLSCIKANDNRVGTATPGSFEIILSNEAKNSNLFALNIDKGNVSIGNDIIVDVTCTLPKPRNLGGIFVGSWQTFEAEVIMKGGWKLDGMLEINKIPIILKAYVSL